MRLRDLVASGTMKLKLPSHAPIAQKVGNQGEEREGARVSAEQGCFSAFPEDPCTHDPEHLPCCGELYYYWRPLVGPRRYAAAMQGAFQLGRAAGMLSGSVMSITRS